MVLDVFYVSSSFHLVPSCTLRFAEALEVHDLTRTQELDDIADVRIIGKAENVVVGHARLLLCCKVLCQVGDGVARDLHGTGGPRRAGGKLWENAGRVVDKIGGEARLADLLLRQIARELVDDGADHLKMPQLLCTDRGSPRATSTKKPCAARVTGRKREGKRECAKCRLAPFL